jgi:hypothetical protein
LPVYRHQGIAKTLERLERNYYFPGIRKVVITEVGEYNLYNKSKADRHTLYRLLQPLPASDRVWKSIVFDFVVKLPLSKELITEVIYNLIWVVTDRLTKYGHFVLYKESSTVEELVYAFLKVVIS